MRKNLIIILLFFCSFSVNAHEYRDLLQKEADISVLKSSLIVEQKWVQYPGYPDRKGWDILTAGFKEDIIQSGVKALDYKWKVIKATDYLEYERSGSRQTMEAPFGANNAAMADLVLAELSEGKGRFIDQIINGIWFTCEMSSWALAAHLPSYQASRRSLADMKESVLDLTAGDLGSFLSWTYYFLKEEFDKVNPAISERLRNNLQARILDTYMNRSDFWWQGFNAKPTTMLNNWNPWCNFNVLTCFLLLENDQDKLAEGVYRTMVSVDKFINYNHEDGACEEGPSYWGHAAGKLYDYLQILSTATADKVSIFDQPIIKNMGEYIAKSYVGKGWVVNFADASAKGGGDKGVIFRYGKAVQSELMQQFAAYLYEQDKKNPYFNSGRDMYRTLENLVFYKEFVNIKPGLSQASSTWYPETEFCYMLNQTGFFLATKGGFNNESHNHNDVGSFSLYIDQTPMIIDVGVGTYTRQTFSSERYKIWTMQSNYHNLPLINGVSQVQGAQFRSRNVMFDPKRLIFSLDLAKAYADEAAVERWQRSYRLEGNNGLIIQDEFRLGEIKAPNQLNFLTWSKPDITIPGIVTLEKEGVRLRINFEPSQFESVVETIPLSDRRLSNVWGEQIYRLTLNAKKKQLVGKYRITINKL